MATAATLVCAACVSYDEDDMMMMWPLAAARGPGLEFLMLSVRPSYPTVTSKAKGNHVPGWQDAKECAAELSVSTEKSLSVFISPLFLPWIWHSEPSTWASSLGTHTRSFQSYAAQTMCQSLVRDSRRLLRGLNGLPDLNPDRANCWR